MRCSIRSLLFFAVLVLASASYAQVQSNYCMDCAQKPFTKRDGTVVQRGLCCMAADNARCAGGWFVVKANVGWHCVIKATPDGGSSCFDSEADADCPKTTGGGGDGDDDDGPLNNCVNEGGCSAACSGCSFP
jgi:hypothetical protein